MMLLNEQQQAVVDSYSSRILCLAGAGTGKTASMIERIVRIIEHGSAPESILALTFTNNAAFEMRARFQRRLPQSTCPEFKTFHAFCYSLICTDAEVRKAVGYFYPPAIATEVEWKSICARSAERVGISGSVSKYLTANVKSLQDIQLSKLLHKCIKQQLRQSNLITFDLLCTDVCNLFKSKHESILKYLLKYKYILVDEFQDTDPVQYEFILAFEQSDIFVVADALQAIYAFRGADSSIVKSLAQSADWDVYRLTQNYRSTVEICQYANQHSVHADDSYRLALIGSRHGDVPIERAATDDITFDVIDAVAGAKHQEGTCALLFRTNAEVEVAKRVLDSLNIPYSSRRNNTYMQYMLRSCIDDTYMLEWFASFLKIDDYSKYIRLTTMPVAYDVTELISDFPQYRFDRMYHEVNQLRSELISSNAVSYIQDRFGVTVDSTNALSERVEMICAQLDTAADCGVADMYVGTIHSVKGLEYDAVAVFGVGGKTFKLTSEENCNLFYVAVTRAKNSLRVYVADEGANDDT